MGRLTIPDAPHYKGAALALDALLTRIGYKPPQMDGDGCLLHISDTPSSSYKYILQLITRLKPSWVIHTGDIADEVKLQMYPYMRPLYLKKALKFSHLLRDCGAHCVITAGNHDDIEILEENMKNCLIIREAITLKIAGISLRIGHYYEQIIKDPADLNLFGHDQEGTSCEKDGKVFLNGLDCAWLVDLGEMKATGFRYPFGTDDERMLKKRIGL